MIKKKYICGMMVILNVLLFAHSAYAADLFTVPDSNKSKVWFLDVLFPGSLADIPLASTMTILNSAVLLVGGILAAYTLIAGTMSTAHDGEMLGTPSREETSDTGYPCSVICFTASILNSSVDVLTDINTPLLGLHYWNVPDPIDISCPHGWHTPPGKDRVRVRKMEWDNTRKAYTFTTEEEKPVTIIWTPDSSGVSVPWNTGNQNPVRISNPVVIDPLPEDTSIEATTTPAPEEKKFADYILILPLPNIPPIYIYLRNNPGQVTGKGQQVSGIWLSDANTGNGSPVPSQIADKLRGQTFENFNQFRNVFWLEVSKNPELSKQFRSHNQTHIRNGNSPFTREADSVGGRERYEIHHIKPISQGGDVYNVDNMEITTPKRHIEIHSTRQSR